MDITEVARREIIDYLIMREKPYWGKLGILEFLGRTWDLEGIPSTDHRQVTAYWDIHRHYMSFSDWDDHYLLYNYFNLHRCDDRPVKLLATSHHFRQQTLPCQHGTES